MGNNLFEHRNEGESLALSIYFNNEKPGWKIEPYLKNGRFEEERFKDEANTLNISFTGISQVPLFVKTSLQENWTYSFFWIFKHPKVYVFQPIGLVFDGEIKDSEFQGHQPKTMPTICKRVLNVEAVPEFFAALNANQGYNRRTIRKFENSIHLMAEHLLFPKTEKLEIKPSKKFDFLSPVQFETLVFLIFHHAGAFCSTFRGGTRPGIDLLAEFSAPPVIPGFLAPGKYFLQVKLKNTDVPKPASGHRNEFLIWLGETDYEHRVLGRDWIDSQVSSNPKVKKWLNRSLDFLQFKQ